MGAVNNAFAAFADPFDDAIVARRLANKKVLAQAILRHGKTLLPPHLVLMLAGFRNRVEELC